MKVGSTTYIRLEGFVPSWRQAVLLEVKRSGLHLAVRVTDAELAGEDEKWKNLTFFEVSGCKFLLVAGDSNRTRPACLAPHRSLEVDPALIVAAAGTILESEDAQFATASDDLGKDKKAKKAHLQLLQDSSGEDSSSDESDEDDVLKILSKARNAMTEEGMLGEDSRPSKKTSRSRYPMLEKAKTKEAGGTMSHLESVLRNSVSAGSQDGMGSLNALVQLEILKTLQGKKAKDKDHGGREEFSGEDTDLSSSSSEGTTRLKGAGKAWQAYRKGRKAMRRRPTKHVKRYIKEVELFLGVSAEMPYQLTDYSKKLSWGKHRSLMRIHFAISHMFAIDVEKQTSIGCPRNDTVAESSAPSFVGQWRLENCVVVDGAPRPGRETEVRGRTPGPRGNRLLPESHGRAREERQVPSSTTRRRPRQGEVRKRKEEGFEDGASRRRSGPVTAEKQRAGLDGGLCIGDNPIFDLINKQHGSFCRYYRIHAKMSQEQTGAVTPDSKAVGKPFALFPSRLPWTISSESKRRRGLKADVRCEALKLMHRIWAFLNYLHAGSPCSTSAISEAVRMAFEGKWTAQHETYARAMHSKLLDYCACPRGTMERGSAKLSALIEKIQCSQYDPSISFDEASCGALPVDPTRISLPDQAGILDPREHLCGERLEQFVQMPHQIPEPCRSSLDPPACHKVSDEDWPVVLRKLFDADMITFIPKKDVLSEGRRLIKGGLFCVPHKPQSDRLINDRRPANLREKRLNWCQLPSGPLLCQLILEKYQSVRASGDDLSNYFYLIKHLESWYP